MDKNVFRIIKVGKLKIFKYKNQVASLSILHKINLLILIDKIYKIIIYFYKIINMKKIYINLKKIYI